MLFPWTFLAEVELELEFEPNTQGKGYFCCCIWAGGLERIISLLIGYPEIDECPVDRNADIAGATSVKVFDSL